MYLSHYMYHGLVTAFTYVIVFLVICIYMMYVSLPLSHVCCLFSLFKFMFLLLYNLSIFHT